MTSRKPKNNQITNHKVNKLNNQNTKHSNQNKARTSKTEGIEKEVLKMI